MPLRVRTTLLAVCLLLVPACLLPAAMASAETSGGTTTASHDTGGVSPSDPRYRPPKHGKIVGGIAFAPRGAPPEVVRVIAAANQLVRMPYHYGGGHRSFVDSGYDCSGSVSFALHGANLLTAP